MALSDDLIKDGTEIFSQKFEVTTGWSSPSTTDVPFDNTGKKIKLVALFVDIRKSTTLVNTLGLEWSARMYKAYVRAVTQIVRARNGRILSFNGDGIVAGFVGSATAENAAVLSGLNLNWFLGNYLKPTVDPLLANVGAPAGLTFDYGIGVDVGDVLVVKAGMRGEDNHDLVWAGNPVNYAVKVASQASLPYSLCVSEKVLEAAHYSLKTYSPTSTFMWEYWRWQDKNQWLWRTTWNYGPEYIRTVPISDPPKPKPGILDVLAGLAKKDGTSPPSSLHRRRIQALEPPKFDWDQMLSPTPPPKLSDILAPWKPPAKKSLGELLEEHLRAQKKK